MRIIVNIDVPELAPALTFYSAALGLELNRILDDDVAELSGAPSVIYLLAKDADRAIGNRQPVDVFVAHVFASVFVIIPSWSPWK